ncbi:MerR family transcriptional regulator [Nocardiopsis sp. TSRI0078]|uniref:MerR family transcriptional regulator n=1 Tax=unclassified Nocardiopsis TaxID=2649073 RepID=UPI00093B0688|nr:MerR family transcriptional regulator [Nocardiopsis sp. TSRI0078]OKI20476.1 MerR family transcriptional regulator [Nocardiopsis sp. TSRI0078]
MSWPMAQVCRMSGVTSRTLRHYHRIGLLEPAWTGPGGIRHYGHEQLLRLQRILLMRELGMGLADIARVLDEHRGQAEALREHLRGLLAERDRIDTLAATVRRTVDALEEGDAMEAANRPEELFAGFDTSFYTEHARTEWPNEWGQAMRATEGLTEDDWARGRAEVAAQMGRMAVHMAAGTPAGDPVVQSEVHAHYLTVNRTWTPDANAFANLGHVYAEEGPWREIYDRVAPGLADYQSEAMRVYAHERLGWRGQA